MNIKLKDVCEFIVDCPHTTAQDEGTGYPLIRTPNIGKGRFNLDGVHRVSQDIYEKRNLRAVPQDNDLIFAREAPAGNVAIIKNGNKFCLGQRTVLIRPNSNCVYPDFLNYFLLAPQQQYGLLGMANGATVAHVNLPTIRELKINIPSLEKQKHIAGILCAYDDLIENNQKQIKLLEEAAQRLYKEWFIDLHFPGWESTTIVDGVPEGWRYYRVEEFGEVITGKTPPTSNESYYNGDIPFVTIPDMHGNVYPIVTEKTLTKIGADTQKNKYIPSGSVMVSCIATVGLVNIAIEKCQTNQQVNSVILYNNTDLYFFYESMKRIKTLLDGVGSNGATMTNVNKKKFSEVQILYPCGGIVELYDKFCRPIFNKIQKNSQQIQWAQEARDRLLPRLMNGGWEV